MSMSVDEPAAFVEKAACCPINLMGTNKFSECNMRIDPNYLCGVDGCTKHHHKSLHGATSPFLANVMETVNRYASATTPEDVLLTVQTIPACWLAVNWLFDNAATCSLITESAARTLNPVGDKINLSISTVTNTKAIKSAVYYIPLVDSNNVTHGICALKVD